jgi:hypothetical protein
MTCCSPPRRISVFLLIGGPVLQGVTIGITYGLAVGLGHVDPWLPMISDLQVRAPEVYVSRVGMPVSTLMMQLALLTHCVWLASDDRRTSGRSRWLLCADVAMATLAALSLCGFYVVGAVSEVANIVVHEAGAVTGFVGMFFYCLYTLIRFAEARRRVRSISHGSLALKAVCTAYLAAALVGGIVLGTLNPFNDVRTECAVLEWTAGLAIGVFFCSFAAEVLVDLRLRPVLRDVDGNPINEQEPRIGGISYGAGNEYARLLGV